MGGRVYSYADEYSFNQDTGKHTNLTEINLTLKLKANFYIIKWIQILEAVRS